MARASYSLAAESLTALYVSGTGRIWDGGAAAYRKAAPYQSPPEGTPTLTRCQDSEVVDFDRTNQFSHCFHLRVLRKYSNKVFKYPLIHTGSASFDKGYQA